MDKITSSSSATNSPTILDVAAALGLHKSTVSLGLSGKGNVSAATRERIMAAARELGYEPNPLAQRLAQGGSKTLVCLCSSSLDVGLTTEKILLIQKELNDRGLEVPIYAFPEPANGNGTSHAAQVRHICRQQPQAIVCAAQMLDPSVFGVLEAYQRDGGIVVSYDIPVPLECDQVVFDREDNAYRGARYLLERGHRRLGIGLSNALQGPADAMIPSQSIRLQGFRRALAEFGLPLRDDWVFHNPIYEKGGAQMARRFLQAKKRPTGLCIVNDYVALSFMVEVMRAGVQVPDDVSIIGHDDQPVAPYCPVPLTSVSQPVEQIVRTVVEMLSERIAGSAVAPRTVVIQGRLVERQSVSAPPHQAKRR